MREETWVTYNLHNGDGFVITTLYGVWRFRRGNFGLHYLDACDLQNFVVVHERVDYHNTDGMLQVPGYEVGP